MKIYVGKNKKEAKLTSLKQLLFYVINQKYKFMKDHSVEGDRLGDNSASWLGLRVPVKNGVIDINIGFDPEDDNAFEDIRVWKSKYKLDEENMKEIT